MCGRPWRQQPLDGELQCIESSQLDGQLPCIESHNTLLWKGLVLQKVWHVWPAIDCGSREQVDSTLLIREKRFPAGEQVDSTLLIREKRFPAAGTYPSGPPEKLTTGSATALATTAFGWRALLDRGLVRASRFTPLPSGERGRSERLPV